MTILVINMCSSVFCGLAPQSAVGGVPTVSRLPEGGRPGAVCYRFQLLAPFSARPTACTSSTQTGDWGGARTAYRGATLNILCHPLRWLCVCIGWDGRLLCLGWSKRGTAFPYNPNGENYEEDSMKASEDRSSCLPLTSPPLCSRRVCSLSGVPLPPSGLPSHLHLLPPADAGQTGRAKRRAGRRSTMWVVVVVTPSAQLWCNVVAVIDCVYRLSCKPHYAPHAVCIMLAGVLCQRPFCHMYWGCQRTGCQGCLARFSGMYRFHRTAY